jgi:beta-N-acetylglucosaminidase
MKKKLNINKVAIAVLSTLVIGMSSTSAFMYNELSNKIEVTEHKLEKANTKINKYEQSISELESSLLLADEDKVNLQKKIKELEGANSSLKGENEGLKQFVDEVLKIPEFDSSNVTSTSNVNEFGLSLALKDTGLEGLESAFIKAEKEYGINAIFLTSLVAQESGWGNSNRAKTQNNLSGYAVYSDSAEGKTFSSKTESIMATARLLKDHYVGKGLYDISSINNKYSADDNWDRGIHSIASDLLHKANLNNYIGV